MKRMKNLLALVMAVVMVLALAIPAFAAGETITVLNPAGHGYKFAKIFEAAVVDNEVVYYATAAQKTAIENASAVGGAFTDLAFEGPNSDSKYIVKKTATYSAADFATWLANNQSLFGSGQPFYYDSADFIHQDSYQAGPPVSYDVTERLTHDASAGYWFILWDNGDPYALTTVLPGGHSDVQNKKDIPFDKDVFRYDNDDPTKIDHMADDGTYSAVSPDFTADNSWDRESVQVGDKLHYVVKAKVPNVTLNTDAFYEVWDVLSAGQSYDPASLKVYVMKNTAAAGETPSYSRTDILPDLTRVNDYTKELSEDQYKTQASDGTADKEIWRIRLDFIEHVKNNPDYQADTEFTIEYDVTVTEDVGVIDNTAHNHYRFDKFEEYKDAQTQNYDSQIVIDKYETGNASQKLEGAKFVLAKDDSIITKADGSLELSSSAVYYIADDIDQPTSVTWGALSNATIATTNAEGLAYFKGLEDGTYYLFETEAPTGYVRLDQPIKIVVNGKAALDPSLVVDNNAELTTSAQLSQLSNDARVGNTPGSVLPSTGGRGTTMLYMAGLGMMLAAGAFLIFRRRAEAGK